MKKFEVEEIWKWRNLKLRKFKAEEIWIWRNLKLKKYEVEEILSWRNFKLKIFEAEEIESWRNLKLKKFEAEEIQSWRNFKLKKFQVEEILSFVKSFCLLFSGFFWYISFWGYFEPLWGITCYFGLSSKTVLGSTHIVEQFLLPSSATTRVQLGAEVVIFSYNTTTHPK